MSAVQKILKSLLALLYGVIGHEINSLYRAVTLFIRSYYKEVTFRGNRLIGSRLTVGKARDSGANYRVKLTLTLKADMLEDLF